MHRHEIAFAKQSALSTNDWDTFQMIIRTCLHEGGTIGGPCPPSDSAHTEQKNVMHQGQTVTVSK